MSAVSLIAVGQLKGQTAPYRLATITGTVYDSGGTSYTIPTPKSLVFFRNKTFTVPVNNLKITTATHIGFLAGLPVQGVADYRADYTTFNGSGNIPGSDIEFNMTGGNSSPIYIYYDTSPINGTTGIQLNNVYYDNLGDISVYFPQGIVNATSTHYNAMNGGYMQISQTEPNDKQRARARQDANGNSIGWPTRY